MVSPLKTLDSSEIVVGLVGRIGLDMREVSAAIERVMRKFDYQTVPIHVTDFIGNFPSLPSVSENPIEKRYKSYIKACNALRKKTQRYDIMAFIGIAAIQKSRAEKTGDYKKPAPRVVYIINQLKRPEEINRELSP